MMIQKRVSMLVSLLLLAALGFNTLPIVTAQPQRDRKVVSASTPPSVDSRKAGPAPAPEAVSVPTAGPASPARFSTTTKTVAELQTRISEILRKTELAPAMVGIKVASLDTGRVLFEENSNKLLRPASNMKLYTVATALDRLSPDYRFRTSVLARAKPDAQGTVHGDLTIYGRGDPSIAARFNGGDYFKGLNELASRIVAAGVKRVDGDLIGDETYFTGPQYGSGWTWDDLQWWYGAEVSALTVNDNALDLFIKPGATVGSPAQITTGPPDPLLTIANRVTTGPKGSRRDISVQRGLGGAVLEVRGSVPVDDSGYTAGIGISQPALLFVYLLRATLVERGVVVNGKSRTLGPLSPANGSTEPKALPLVELANMQSPPFSLVAAQTLKPSQNLYTELILRTLGKEVPPVVSTPTPARSSEDAGLEVVKAFLKQAGITPTSLSLNDGSGLSRNDMVTAEATLTLLTYMNRHAYAKVFREALPIAGVDGTLRNRMKGTPAENNVKAKTGSLSSAASLSGYVTTAAGENLVFSIMVNNYPEDTEVRAICIDPIAVLLASFAGKS